MFAYYEGVLHSIGEGLVLQDASRDVVLYNDRAAELLGIPPLRTRRGVDARAVPLAQLALPEVVAAVLARGDVVVDEIVITPTHVLVVDRDRVVSRAAPRASVVGRVRGARGGGTGNGRSARGRTGFVGTVTTLRDHTRLQELTGELATMTTLSDALRSQAHEFANRLHTMIALIELDRAPEAAELAVSELTLSQQLADRILTAVDEPVLLALLLGKSAQAAERGIALDIDIPQRVSGGGAPPRELITIVGNLIDNAMDAVAGSPTPAVGVEVESLEGGGLRIVVSDSGPGPHPAVADHLFELGVTSKSAPGHGIGLALVRQAVTRLGGTLTLAGSRFTVLLPAPTGATPDIATPTATANTGARHSATPDPSAGGPVRQGSVTSGAGASEELDSEPHR